MDPQPVFRRFPCTASPFSGYCSPHPPFTHKPKTSPEGITGPYTVRLGRAISISEYHTSYHSNFVEVPKMLVVRKGDGEAFQVVLTRVGDSIQVTELR